MVKVACRVCEARWKGTKRKAISSFVCHIEFCANLYGEPTEVVQLVSFTQRFCLREFRLWSISCKCVEYLSSPFYFVLQ